jgi:hypothetical protein
MNFLRQITIIFDDVYAEFTLKRFLSALEEFALNSRFSPDVFVLGGRWIFVALCAGLDCAIWLWFGLWVGRGGDAIAMM